MVLIFRRLIPKVPGLTKFRAHADGLPVAKGERHRDNVAYIRCARQGRKPHFVERVLAAGWGGDRKRGVQPCVAVTSIVANHGHAIIKTIISCTIITYPRKGGGGNGRESHWSPFVL